MYCPKCEGRLVVVKTIPIGGQLGRTSDSYCPKCNRKFTLVTCILKEYEKPGDGAKAQSRKLSQSWDNGIDIINPQAIIESDTGDT